MRNLLNLIAITLIGISLNSSTCNECVLLDVADLAVQRFDRQLEVLSQNEVWADVTIEIVNLLLEFSDCETTNTTITAPSNEFLGQIVYSQNGSFNDAVIVDEYPLRIEPLDTEEMATVSDRFSLNENGSYRFFSNVDNLDEVDELNEDNNDSEDELKFSQSTTIVVTTLKPREPGEIIDYSKVITRLNPPTVTYKR